jgi:hypothetical protein
MCLFSLRYGKSKRSGKYEIAYAHLFSFMTDQRLETWYNASLPFVDVHILLTEGSKS